MVGAGVAPPSGEAIPTAPFTRPRWQSGQAFYYADIDAIRDGPAGLGTLVLAGHVLELDGQALAGIVRSVAVHPRGFVPPFDDVAEAVRAVSSAPWPDAVAEIDAEFVLVDVAIAYPAAAGTGRIALRSTLDPGPLGQPDVATLVVDHRGDGESLYREAGLLHEGIAIAPGSWTSLVHAGVAHVLSGPDHLLLVACLVLGAAGPAALGRRVTGFTLGHATVAALGWHGAPVLDIAVAVSIGLVGIMALRVRSGRVIMPVIVGIGAVHGLGDPGRSGPLGFSLGIELGQLAAGLVLSLFVRALTRLEVDGSRSA